MYAILISIIMVLVITPSNALAANSGKININITGLNNNKGVARIAVYNNKDSYKSDDGSGDKAFQRAAVKISDNKAIHTFDAIPFGTYAIKVFHDETNCGKFLTNMVGIPKVQYGFSNNVRGRFGPASFEKAQFIVNKPESKIAITVK